MKTHLMFTLPWPPSVNTYYRMYMSRLLISRKGREYRRTVIGEICRQKVTQGLSDARISLTIAVYPPDKRKRDLDNLLKPLIDAMGGAGLFTNDEQIDEIMITREAVDIDGPGYVRIHLTELVEGK